MLITAAVKQVLAAANPVGKVWEGVRPQSAGVPALTFIVPSRSPEEHLRGDAGLMHAIVQVDAWAKHLIEAEELAAQARTLMIASALFQASTLPGGFDDYEEDTKLRRVSQDYSVWLTTT